MRHQSFPIGIVAVVCGLVAGATPARAAIATWVSGTGTDTGICPITAPCRTFGYAHGQTTANGAITVLTAGNFGPLNISKPISVIAEGVEAVINGGLGGIGIYISAPANAVILLRGLTIDMRGSTSNTGIFLTGGAALHVQNCVIRRGDSGIAFSPASAPAELYVTDSIIEGNRSSGISIQSNGSAGIKAVIDRVRVENNGGTGITFQTTGAGAPITATVRDSSSAGNAVGGLTVTDTFGAGVDVTLVRAALLNNTGSGIFANGAGAVVRMGNSTVTGNGAGLSFSGGGLVTSYGTNKINGNGGNETPSNTITMK